MQANPMKNVLITKNLYSQEEKQTQISSPLVQKHYKLSVLSSLVQVKSQNKGLASQK